MPDIHLANSGNPIRNFGTVVWAPPTGAPLEESNALNTSLELSDLELYADRYDDIDPQSPT